MTVHQKDICYDETGLYTHIIHMTIPDSIMNTTNQSVHGVISHDNREDLHIC